jgi:hypothetical protein
MDDSIDDFEINIWTARSASTSAPEAPHEAVNLGDELRALEEAATPEGEVVPLVSADPEVAEATEARQPTARESAKTQRVYRSRVGIVLAVLSIGAAAGWAANSHFTKSANQASNEGKAIGAALAAPTNAKAAAAAEKKGYAAGHKAAAHVYPTVVKHKTVTQYIRLTALTASPYQLAAIWAIHQTRVPANYCHTATVSNDWAYAQMSFHSCPGKKPMPTKTEWFHSNGGAWTSLGQSACQIPAQYRPAFSISSC